jgi:hypothetical protein
MFEKVIKIYNEKHPERKITKRMLVQGWVLENLCSYAYGWKLYDAVNSGKQIRINWKILKYTAGFCEVSMDELFKQF